MAERERFELSEGYYPSLVFKTSALNHSATSPMKLFIDVKMVAGEGFEPSKA
tara:strand:- start:673 stop:828 length:156 start_codon:yes stop_codon:yes gene_type:complete